MITNLFVNQAFPRLQKLISHHHLDGLWLLDGHNRFWATGFPSSDGCLFVNAQKIILFLDGRYLTAAQQQVKHHPQLEIRLWPKQSLFQQVKQEFDPQRIGADGAILSFRQFKKLQKIYPVVVDVSTANLRQVKSDTEIKKMTSAVRLSEQALVKTQQQIKIGMSEVAIRRLFTQNLWKLGSDGESFPTIVASGTQGAMPHAIASAKKIVENELVTIDFGCCLNGYVSDMTRTFQVGQPSSQLLNIFKVVAMAQQLGIAAVKPGVTTKEIDAVCRNYIAKAGYGQYFTHSTGHGVGVEVHEPPYVHAAGQTKLEPGMVITVEPGVYIPAVGGVRIEDQVLVTRTGHRLMSSLPRYDQNVTPFNLLKK